MSVTSLANDANALLRRLMLFHWHSRHSVLCRLVLLSFVVILFGAISFGVSPFGALSFGVSSFCVSPFGV